jgi:hypothetical protein
MNLKKNIVLFLLFGYTILANSQETIISIENEDLLTDPKDNVYYKDVNNLLDKFVDTWVFDDGTHYLKIEITKVIKELIGYGWETTTIYEDLLHVKFQYKLNGVEIYNTLLLDRAYIEGHSFYVDSDSKNRILLTYSEPSLTSCRRTKTGFLSLEFVPSTTPNPNLLADDDATLVWHRRYGSNNILQCPDGSNEDETDLLIPAILTLHRE